MRIDPHVHSKYSKRPSQGILKKLGCPESFTEPLQIYQVAKARGMTHVTIADHNTISGALEIAHLPDTFVSEEITTYFPDNECKIHVLALNITEAQHREIQKVRPNIFELAAYVRDQRILNIVAHPLYAVNERLTMDYFEKLLLLFQNFELNGARNHRENQCLKLVLNKLTPEIIERLADTHNMAPLYSRPWQKRLWGGSDDHSSLNITRTHTEITGADHPGGLTLDNYGITTKVISSPATPLTMAHNLYGIAYQFYHSKLQLKRYTDKDLLMRFLDANLRVDSNNAPRLISKLYLLWQHRRDKKAKGPVSDSLMSLLRYETHQMIQDDPAFFQVSDAIGDHAAREQKWFDFVNQASQRVMLHFGNHLLDHLSGADVFNIFTTIGSAGGLYTMMAPYFVAYAQFAKDRHFSDTVRRRFAPDWEKNDAGTADDLRVAQFTDTFYEVNGVALTLQQHVKLALENGKYYRLVTCHPEGDFPDEPGIHNFKPVGSYELPEYPEQKIFYPPFLDMLHYCYSEGFTQIHTATPGPIGLAALAIAKILKLPVSGTYHTAIPQYARVLTGDDAIEELSWKYVLWYYDQLDVIYAPSCSTADELIQKGISADKIRVYPRGIDVQRFHPSKRNGILKTRFNVRSDVKFLYVGRVSREKNLHYLAQAFKRLIEKGGDAHLIVVGDGPYQEDMKREMAGFPCLFTGYQDGEDLSEIYASADVFVFPSTTDTFGNVVLEAQSSGLPVIVTDQGGPCENITPDETGMVIGGDDAGSLLEAMLTFVRHPRKITEMGRAARRLMEMRSFQAAFLETWEMYHQDSLQPLAAAG